MQCNGGFDLVFKNETQAETVFNEIEELMDCLGTWGDWFTLEGNSVSVSDEAYIELDEYVVEDMPALTLLSNLCLDIANAHKDFEFEVSGCYYDACNIRVNDSGSYKEGVYKFSTEFFDGEQEGTQHVTGRIVDEKLMIDVSYEGELWDIE